MSYVKFMVMVFLTISIAVFSVAQVREWMERDVSKPVIECETEMILVSSSYTEEELMGGLKAHDWEDGDLTDKILVGEVSRFISRGICNVTYVVFDKAGNAATLVRKMKMEEYEPPKFTLKAPLVYKEAEGSSQKTEYRLGAVDMIDGDLTEWIQIVKDPVDYQLAGDYVMTLDVSNSYGDTVSVDLPVHIRKAGSLKLDIELSEYLVYSRVGESVNPAAYITGLTDTMGNEIDSRIVKAESGVDINTPGCYEIHYTAVDNGNIGETWLTVIVWE